MIRLLRLDATTLVQYPDGEYGYVKPGDVKEVKDDGEEEPEPSKHIGIKQPEKSQAAAQPVRPASDVWFPEPHSSQF